MREGNVDEKQIVLFDPRRYGKTDAMKIETMFFKKIGTVYKDSSCESEPATVWSIPWMINERQSN